MASPEEPPLSRLGSGNLVEVYVGPRKVKWCVHEDLLRQSAPFFESALSGGFREAETKQLHLPEDDEGAFELFVAWLYADDRFTLKVPYGVGVDIPARKYLNLYILASKLLIPELENLVVDAIYDSWWHGPSCCMDPEIEDVQYLYNNTRRGSKMRRLLAELTAIHIMYGETYVEFPHEWHETLCSTPELACDIIRIIYEEPFLCKNCEKREGSCIHHHSWDFQNDAA